MKFSEVKKKIKQIGKYSKLGLKELNELNINTNSIKNTTIALKKSIELNYDLHEKPKIKKIIRKNYYDFYEVLGYNESGNEILGDNLGHISLPEYEKNKKEIEQLRATGKIEELKKYFN